MWNQVVLICNKKLGSLFNAETMLFVNDQEADSFKFDMFLEQSVRADNHSLS